jgi:hypothetical protein
MIKKCKVKDGAASPMVEISGKNFSGEYFLDGSGESTIFIGKKGGAWECKVDGKIKDHIRYFEAQIKQQEKQIQTYKDLLQDLKIVEEMMKIERPKI